MGLLAAGGWSALGAGSLLIGAWLALNWRPPSEVVGLIMGFGAGTLIGAIAYELIPAESLRNAWTYVAFGFGAVVFFVADRLVTGRHQANTDASKSIVLGALLDGVPESLVLGMSLAAGGKVSVAFLAAVFLSNLPEALGATSGMRAHGHQPARIYRMWTWIVLSAAGCGALGYGALKLLPQADGSYVEAFAAGAVLTMLANSMMPEALKEGGRRTGLLTALGFVTAGVLTMLE